MSLLQVAGISVQESSHTALQDISFSLPEGRRLAIAGETGAGKSTLLQVIAGLVQPTAGTVTFDGRRVRGNSPSLIGPSVRARNRPVGCGRTPHCSRRPRPCCRRYRG